MTGFMLAAALCEAHHTDQPAHCAPALHRHLGCAAPRFRPVQWLHDPAFDGAPVPHDGKIGPDPSRPNPGLALKRHDAEPFAVSNNG